MITDFFARITALFSRAGKETIMSDSVLSELSEVHQSEQNPPVESEAQPVENEEQLPSGPHVSGPVFADSEAQVEPEAAAQEQPEASPDEEVGTDAYATGVDSMKGAIRRLRNAELVLLNARRALNELENEHAVTITAAEGSYTKAKAELTEDTGLAAEEVVAAQQNLRVAIRHQRALLEDLEAALPARSAPNTNTQ